MTQAGHKDSSPMVIMGRVAGAQGIQGWLKVQSYTEPPENLLEYRSWWLGSDAGGWQERDVLNSSVHGKGLIAQVMGCHDRNTAETYKGLLIAVPRNRLPQPEADEYYWTDLVGLEVVNEAGARLGAVSGLLDTGANQVLRVAGENGEILIPFIASAVKQVDLEGRTIRVDWEADY